MGNQPLKALKDVDRAEAGNADPLAALRTATASRHEVLDRSMPLAMPEPTLLHYRDHLRLLHAWLAPLERWLGTFNDGPQGVDAPAKLERAALIAADLADPSIPAATPTATTAVPAALDGRVQPWPERGSPAYRWGVCYVIEGSQLGGVVLHRMHAQRLAPHPLRYLNGDGAPPGPRWQRFIAALRVAVRTPAEIAQACEGACDAFDALLLLKRGQEPGTVTAAPH
jgi:heme oxygenase